VWAGFSISYFLAMADAPIAFVEAAPGTGWVQCVGMLQKLPVAQAAFGAAMAGLSHVQGAKAVATALAAAARGAAQGAVVCPGAPGGDSGDALNRQEEVLDAIKRGVGLLEKPTVSMAKSLLRDRGGQPFAARLSRLSKARNSAAHADVGLPMDVAAFLSETASTASGGGSVDILPSSLMERKELEYMETKIFKFEAELGTAMQLVKDTQCQLMKDSGVKPEDMQQADEEVAAAIDENKNELDEVGSGVPTEPESLVSIGTVCFSLRANLAARAAERAKLQGEEGQAVGDRNPLSARRGRAG